jgi:hypothetical protein
VRRSSRAGRGGKVEAGGSLTGAPRKLIDYCTRQGSERWMRGCGDGWSADVCFDGIERCALSHRTTARPRRRRVRARLIMRQRLLNGRQTVGRRLTRQCIPISQGTLGRLLSRRLVPEDLAHLPAQQVRQLPNIGDLASSTSFRFRDLFVYARSRSADWRGSKFAAPAFR